MPLIPVQRDVHMADYLPRVELGYAQLTGLTPTLPGAIGSSINGLTVTLSGMSPVGVAKDVDWGDGETSDTLGETLAHTYAAGQPYTITVRYGGIIADTIEIDLTP